MTKIFLHSLRSLRSFVKGLKYDRKFALASYERSMKSKGLEAQREGDGVTPLLHPSVKASSGSLNPTVSKGNVMLPINCETKMKIYVGVRLIDSFMHVNNMRYLELFELGRWHHMGVTDIGRRSLEGCVMPLVSSANVQYVREIKPFQTVVVRTRMVGVSGKGLVHLQQIESVDGKTVFAVGIVRLVWLLKEKPTLLSKYKPGSLEVEEVLTRMGCSQNDINSILSNSYDDSYSADGSENGTSQSPANMEFTGSRYWGRPISKYDQPLTESTSEIVASLSAMVRMYNPKAVTEVNNSDKSWRDDVSAHTKERKTYVREIVNKK